MKIATLSADRIYLLQSWLLRLSKVRPKEKLMKPLQTRRAVKLPPVSQDPNTTKAGKLMTCRDIDTSWDMTTDMKTRRSDLVISTTAHDSSLDSIQCGDMKSMLESVQSGPAHPC